MLHQIKIFFIFISIVFIVETAISPPKKDDLEIKTCSQKEIEVIANKIGFYYAVEKKPTNYPKVGTIVKTGEIFKIPIKNEKTIRVIRTDVENVVTQTTTTYDVSCTIVRKVTLKTTLDVNKILATAKPVEQDVMKDGNITFSTKGKTVATNSAVNLGDKVKMTVTAKDTKIKYIEVQNCSVSSGVNTQQFYPWKNNPINLKNTSSSIFTFDAFRMLKQPDLHLTFTCEVLFCSDQLTCKMTTYELGPRNLNQKTVKGVLAVYLSENQILSSSGKLSSYSIGLLMTMGAVFLQHQFI